MDKLSSFKQELENGIKNYKLFTYIYSYPSKRTYRKLNYLLPLQRVWGEYNKELNIYIHIPFCKHRCSYCTLFMCVNHTRDLIDEYVKKICSQIYLYGQYAKNGIIKSIYFGGGTPTLMSKKHFNQIFETLHNTFSHIASDAEITIEGTPESYTDDILKFFIKLGINRVSVGVQSLNEDELKLIGRKNSTQKLIYVIENISSRFKYYNIDLIYGLIGQTEESWFKTLRKIIEYKPSIISLYPIVIRPSTNISDLYENAINTFMTDKEKYEIYDENISFLERNGYKQDSFNRFSKIEKSSYLQETLDFKGIPLIGIGAGARSYKNEYHYSTDYSVNQKTSLEIIKDFINTGFDHDYKIDYGIVLNSNELKRRYIILNLTLGYLDMHEYIKLFPSASMEDFNKNFKILQEKNLINIDENFKISLTHTGFKFSNLISSLFFSQEIINLENEFNK